MTSAIDVSRKTMEMEIQARYAGIRSGPQEAASVAESLPHDNSHSQRTRCSADLRPWRENRCLLAALTRGTTRHVMWT